MNEAFENFYYEAKPYLCLSGSVYILASDRPHKVLVISALLLMAAGAYILLSRFKNRGGTNIESIFYQSQPFIYLAMAGYVLTFNPSSKIAIGSALLLMFAAIIILRWRYGARGMGRKEMPKKPDRFN